MLSTEITVDIRMFYSSGIGTCIRNLLPLLIDERPDYKFNLLCDIDNITKYDWAHKNNVRLISCKSPIYSIAEQFELYRAIPKSSDLFWSPHYNIPILYKGALVVTVHDIFHLAMPQYVRGIHKRLYAKWMYIAVQRKASSIICDSEFTAREFQRLIGFDDQRLKVVYNGVDSKWHAIEKNTSPCTNPYIVYVGNVKPHKNLIRLIQAFETLTPHIPHDLIIVGRKDGFVTGDETVIQYANRSKDRIIVTGFVTDDILQQYVVHADALVLPSLYEGFGLTPLEAMACGCPCVVSHAASLPEVCGDAALYFDPYNIQAIADSIKVILSDAGLRHKLKTLGYERAKNFTWQRSAQSVLDIIEETIDSS